MWAKNEQFFHAYFKGNNIHMLCTMFEKIYTIDFDIMLYYDQRMKN